MRNFVVNPDTICRLYEVSDLGENSTIFVLYEAGAFMHVSDVAWLYETHAKLVFIEVKNRDEILLCAGAIMSRTNAIIFDDSVLSETEIVHKLSAVFSDVPVANAENLELSSDLCTSSFELSVGVPESCDGSAVAEPNVAASSESLDDTEQETVSQQARPSYDYDVFVQCEGRQELVSYLMNMLSMDLTMYGYYCNSDTYGTDVLLCLMNALTIESAHSDLLLFAGGTELYEKLLQHINEVTAIVSRAKEMYHMMLRA